jgi:hypothetical protein
MNIKENYKLYKDRCEDKNASDIRSIKITLAQQKETQQPSQKYNL